MAEDPTNVLVPSTGSYAALAPVGTTGPTDIDDTLNVAFVEVGYLSDDAPNLGQSRDVSEIRDWLGRLVRQVNASVTRSITLPLLETTAEALLLAFDGGTFTSTSGGVKFVPGSSAQERALVLHMVDGEQVFRLHIPRAIVNEVGEITPSAEAGTVWAITFNVADPGGGDDPFEVFTNLPGVVDNAELASA